MEIEIIIMNFLYAGVGAVATILFMIGGYKMLDRMTPFDTSQQLKEGNTAVGIVVGCMFVGLGVAIGLVIGLGLN